MHARTRCLQHRPSWHLSLARSTPCLASHLAANKHPNHATRTWLDPWLTHLMNRQLQLEPAPQLELHSCEQGTRPQAFSLSCVHAWLTEADLPCALLCGRLSYIVPPCTSTCCVWRCCTRLRAHSHNLGARSLKLRIRESSMLQVHVRPLLGLLGMWRLCRSGDRVLHHTIATSTSSTRARR